ncbi:ParA family protein [Ideonella sp. YS5]|uniref:ParA family protein n=1 Tax=Ideonella sp. YS5 TaxID=3453714 RepID=UPI003EF0230B
MIHTFAALNSKGGVGKTTFLANLGGLLADMGARTLLVDADPQPSLTKYFGLAYEAPQGLVEVVTQGVVTSACISGTSVPNLDLVRSNDGDANLQHWLHGRPDARSRLARALQNPYVLEHYDFVLIDTQGAIGPLQTAAAFAADTLVSPLPPDTPSVREFRSGTLRVLQRLEHDESEPRAQLAPIQAVICKFDCTRNARQLLSELRAEFDAGDRVTILDTVIPNAVAYKDAFTARRPVHQISRQGGSRFPSGYEVMHRLVWELQPNLYGHFAGRLTGDPEEVFGPPEATEAQGGAT